MSLAQLVNVVTPPARPLNAGNPGHWSSVQKELGIELPTDYLEYALRYGSGDFGDPLWLHVWNPLNSKFVMWVRGVSQSLEAYNKILADGNVPPRRLGGMDGPPLLLFPACPGFLPIGSSLTGDRLGFWTEGVPEKWHVVLVLRNAEEDYGRTYDMPLTEFLARLHSEPWRTEMGPYWNPDEEPRPEVPEFRPNAFTC